MILRTRNLIILFLLICNAPALFSQNARQFFRTGITFVEAGNHTDAIGQFTKVLEIDPANVQAYIERSRSFEAIGELRKAADDLKKALTFEQKEPGLYYNTARILFLIGKNREALEQVNKSISLNRKSDAAFRLLARIQMAMEDYSGSLMSINRALELKENADNFYFRGHLSEIMKNLTQAETDYNRAIVKNDEYTEAYLALAVLKLRLSKPKEAIENCNIVLESDPLNRNALLIRSKGYVSLKNYPEAIDDVSKILASNPEDRELYFIRGTYYQDFTQHQAAINDFSKVLLIDPRFSEALFRRAGSYEQIGDFNLAIRDYERLTVLSSGDENANKHLSHAKERLFELNRESDAPVFELIEPIVNSDSTIKVPRTNQVVQLTGRISDASDITLVAINKKTVTVIKNGDYYEFTAIVDISVTDLITINIMDVYDNLKTGLYSIYRTETDAPAISVLSPYASDNGEIYLDNDNPGLYIEGKINDESRIHSILIDGITASFAIDELDPSFTATINVSNKNKFNVTATDVFGNDTTITYVLNRNGISMLEENPMGRTWVVFIENSNYESLPSLTGPSDDVSLIRSALSGYDIHKIIHKEDMTKKEMERFFSIELRDLLRSNKVNSLMIWYAGHGKYFNETGFWIPTDARPDDEFTYYNLNALRASLQSFSNVLTHNLVISDACESGATFNQAMRDMSQEKDCGNWEAVKFKSAQAFTSAGYEIASDQSQFTKTFASVLDNNPDACLPIETVVNIVTEAVKQTSSQEPRFGKINGLTDEGGTFFFVSKKK